MAMLRKFSSTVIFIMVILKNTNLSLQATCPRLCHCDEEQQTVSCRGARNLTSFEKSGFPTNTKLLSLVDMGINSDEDLKNITRGLTELVYLNISHNAFTRLPMKTVAALPRLATLVLHNNLISELPIELLDTTNHNGIYLDLTGNPLICTCETVYIVQNRHKHKFIGRCIRPLNISLDDLSANFLNCNPCKNERCSFRGECVQQNILNFTCNCFPGFSGRYCKTSVSLTSCPKNICLNNGICRYEEDRNLTICTCNSGTSGERCETVEKADQPNPDIIIALVISVIVLIIVVMFVFYFLRLRPRNMRTAEFGRNSCARQQAVSGRVVRSSKKNNGYSSDEDPNNVTYPHDPAHNRWLAGRRRCSTILEERASREGSCLEESIADKSAKLSRNNTVFQ